MSRCCLPSPTVGQGRVGAGGRAGAAVPALGGDFGVVLSVGYTILHRQSDVLREGDIERDRIGEG